MNNPSDFGKIWTHGQLVCDQPLQQKLAIELPTHKMETRGISLMTKTPNHSLFLKISKIFKWHFERNWSLGGFWH